MVRTVKENQELTHKLNMYQILNYGKAKSNYC